MTSTPKISFIIPAYNHASFIEEALDSVVKDKYPNKELLIINDGSTDETDDVVRRWIAQIGQPFPIRYLSRENRGVTKTLNELVRLASGDYFRILASDDRLLPNGTLHLFETLNSRPGKSAVAGDSEIIDAHGAVVGPSIIRRNGGDPDQLRTPRGLQEQIISAWSFAGAAVLIQTDYFKSIGLYDEESRVEDWDAYLRLTADDRLVATASPVAQYRIHGNNTSQTRVPEMRVQNQEFQLRASEKHLPKFQGRSRHLLSAQRSLIKAKICFLKRSYLRVAVNLAAHSFHRLKAKLERA